MANCVQTLQPINLELWMERHGGGERHKDEDKRTNEDRQSNVKTCLDRDLLGHVWREHRLSPFLFLCWSFETRSEFMSTYIGLH